MILRTIVTLFAMIPFAGASTPQLDTDSGNLSPYTYRPGDANADHKHDIGDALATLYYLFIDEKTPLNPEAADFNNDQLVNFVDALATLKWLLMGDVGPARGTQYVPSKTIAKELEAINEIKSQVWYLEGVEDKNTLVIQLVDRTKWYDTQLLDSRTGEVLGEGTFDIVWSSTERTVLENITFNSNTFSITSRMVSGYLGGSRADVAVFGSLSSIHIEHDHGKENQTMLSFVPLASGSPAEMTKQAQAREHGMRMESPHRKSNIWVNSQVDSCLKTYQKTIAAAKKVMEADKEKADATLKSMNVACALGAAACKAGYPLCVIACIYAAFEYHSAQYKSIQAKFEEKSNAAYVEWEKCMDKK